MKELFEELQAFVCNQLIPNSLDHELKIEGCMLYGSRVLGFSRENSDVDALFIIKGISESKEESWSMEHHGSIKLLNRIMLTELRFYTSKSFRRMLNDFSLVQLHALSTGQIFSDSCGLLDELKQASNIMLNTAVNGLIEELKELDINATINILRIHFSEARNILLDTSSLNNPLYANARLIEYIMDFYVHGSRLIFASQFQKNNLVVSNNEFAASKDILKNLLLLSEYRGARVLDSRKFAMLSIFQELTIEINEIFKHNNYLFEHKIQKFFEIFDIFSIKYFGTSLILKTDEICQVVLK